MEYVTVIFSLVGVIGLIFATYYGTKWLSKRVNFTGNSIVKVHERVNLGTDKAMMIISIGEKYMLLGVTQQHIEKIADLEKSDVDELIKKNNIQTKQTFSMQLLNALNSKKQSKGGNKIDEN